MSALYLLTGDIQTGKTRWLQDLVESVYFAGGAPYGVIAPGVWEETFDGGEIHRVKTGIDNVLLPQNQSVSFARRADSPEAKNFANTQSSAGKLAWSISDDAISAVNQHFENLQQECCKSHEGAHGFPRKGGSSFRDSFDSGEHARRGLLVVDELGILELQRNAGLTCALSLLGLGPTVLYENAVVVVREWLLDQAKDLLSSAWGECVTIFPNTQAKRLVIDSLDFDMGR